MFLVPIPVFLPLMMQQEGLFKGTVYNFMNRALLMVSAFVLNVFASHFLSREQFGEAQFINWVAAFSWMIFHLGIPGILSRFVPGRKGREWLKQLLRHTLFLLLAGLLLAFSFAYMMAPHSRYLWITLLLVLMHMLTYYLVAWLQSLLVYRRVFIAQGVASLVSLTTGFIFIPHYGLDAYILCLILLHVISLGLLFVPWIKMMRKTGQSVSSETDTLEIDKPLLYKTTIYLACSALFSAVLWQRSEVYVIKQVLGTAEVAVYAVAFSLIAMATEPFRMLTGTLTNYFSLRLNQGHQASEMFFKLYKNLWVLTVFSSVFIWVYAPEVVGVFYPRTFGEAANIIRILIPGVLPAICSYIVMSYHVAAGRARFLFLQDVLSAFTLLSLVLYLCLVAEDGIIGVAVSRTGALLFSATSGIIYSVWSLKLRFPFKAMLISSGLVVGILYLSSFIRISTLTELVLIALFSFILYLGILRLSGIISKEELNEWRDKIKDFFSRQ